MYKRNFRLVCMLLVIIGLMFSMIACSGSEGEQKKRRQREPLPQRKGKPHKAETTTKAETTKAEHHGTC